MKLWQKIFFITLVLTLIGTQLTAYLITYRNFKEIVNTEQERVLAKHRLFLAGIERSESGDYDIFIDDQSSVIITKGKNKIYKYKSDALEGVSELPEPEEGATAQTVTDSGDETLCICASIITLDDKECTVYEAWAITGLYDEFAEQQTTIRQISYLVSVIIVAVLLIVIYFFLKPLDDIREETIEISKGNYTRRIEVAGSPEMKEIATNINKMADSFEGNVDSLTEMADSRKQFIDNFAHELKTPLTSIMGFADILRIKRNISEKQRVEYASVIVEETKRLRSLSSKLLEIATAGEVNLDLEVVRVSELFREIHASVLPLLHKNSMSLLISCPPDAYIRADRELIKSLIYNLIDNSVKASKAGDVIRLEAKLKDKRVIICVIDNGIGMKPEHVKRITEPFYMVDKSRARKAGGAGLGLALCVEIVKQHNAKFKINSEYNKGTVVMVAFEAVKGQTETGKKPMRESDVSNRVPREADS